MTALKHANVLLVLLAAAALPAAAVAAEDSFPAAVHAKEVFLRSGPHENYRDMGKLEQSALVNVLEVSPDGNWFRIIPPETADVWIFAQFVDVDGAVGVVNADRVNVRVRPDRTGEEVNKLDKGATVKVKEREGDWLRIAPPEGTHAWISAAHAKKLTEAEVKDRQEQIARELAEQERRKAEEALKGRAAALLAEADKTFAAEFGKPANERDLAGLLAVYQAGAEAITDPGLLEKIAARIALIKAFESVRAASAGTNLPPPLPDLDLDKLAAELGIPAAAEELRAAHTEAQKLAREGEEARRLEEEERKSRRTACGWVQHLRPGLKDSGATHAITADGRVVALVRSGSVNLDAFIGVRVRVSGKPCPGSTDEPGEGPPLIDVLSVEELFD